jgi:hypothetical protein
VDPGNAIKRCIMRASRNQIKVWADLHGWLLLDEDEETEENMEDLQYLTPVGETHIFYLIQGYWEAI